MKRALKWLLARRILAGLFAGMRYLGYSSGSTLMPKILGTYEQELHPLIARLLPDLATKVVVVGAAEGYYAVGLLCIHRDLKVLAFELDAEARDAMAKLAHHNGVSGRLEIKEACSVESLNTVLSEGSVDLLLMDVEGFENVLLDLQAVPPLAGCQVLVELHDFEGGSMAEKLKERFSATHEITHIACKKRAPQDIQSLIYRVTAQALPFTRHALLWERGDEAGWLHLVPRNPT